jgi:hypothetical protein
MTTIWPIAPPQPRRQVAEDLAAQCAAAGLPTPARCYRIGAWTVALAWPEQRLAVEVAGGCWQDRRRARGLTGTGSFTKSNALVLAGWRCLAYGPQQVADGSAVRQIAAALGSAGVVAGAAEG